ncbi:MAG: PIG-L family deacetylase [Endomicrobiales bacterium]|nr:PIG-L family deacetylase [Endomicrobiales bacterium]
MQKFFRNTKLFSYYEKIQPALKYSFSVQDGPPVKNVLVIAPHQDDESIACGGAITKHTSSGGKASVLFLTSDMPERAQEASNACKIIGVDEVISLKHSADTLHTQKTISDSIENVIKQQKPEVVFAPFWLDNHSDHRAAASALAKLAKKYDFIVYAYGVWLPVYPNVLIDCSKHWDSKMSAIGCYKSQLKDRDYIAMADGISKYWACVKGRGITNAEVYFVATIKEYATMQERIFGKL